MKPSSIDFESISIEFVVCRIRSFPTLISKIKWFGSELPLIKKYHHFDEMHHTYNRQKQVIQNISLQSSMVHAAWFNQLSQPSEKYHPFDEMYCYACRGEVSEFGNFEAANTYGFKRISQLNDCFFSMRRYNFSIRLKWRYPTISGSSGRLFYKSILLKYKKVNFFYFLIELTNNEPIIKTPKKIDALYGMWIMNLYSILYELFPF